jgi:hypothetical protein
VGHDYFYRTCRTWISLLPEETAKSIENCLIKINTLKGEPKLALFLLHTCGEKDSHHLLYERCLSYARLTCDEDVLFSAHILIYKIFLFEGKFISNEDV